MLAGDKTATAGLADDYAEEGAPVPAVGARRVLLGYHDEEVGIVEITEARVLPASEIDLAFALDEGEGFESVEDWRIAHERFVGRPIRPDTQIVAVRFRLLERL